MASGMKLQFAQREGGTGSGKRRKEGIFGSGSGGIASAKEKGLAMNMLLKVQGCWNVAKGRWKQTLARMADDQQQFMEGKRDELVGRIQQTRLAGQANSKEWYALKTTSR